jgi:allantoinase
LQDFIIRGKRIALPDGVRAAAIQVSAGRITAIHEHTSATTAHPSIDAGDCVVLPGLVDTHVHMNDPGRADWEGAEHATAAAAAGGITTVVDMPLNSVPSTTTVRALEAKRRALEGRCAVDVGLWGGVVPGNVADLAPLAREGVLGFKCFLAPSGVDEFEHVESRDLRDALPHLAHLGLPLLVHAESPARLLTPDSDAPCKYSTWLASRPPAAEQEAIDLLISLADEHRTDIHIVHLASADAIASLRAARQNGVPITVETCPHYLTFAAEDIRDGATAFKCAPPIRERAHREGLWQALRDGDIDLVATDHSPAPPSMKCLESGDFIHAWGGIASLQLALSIVWTGAAQRNIPIQRVVDWMAAAPARLAGLSGRKGSIAIGADADLAFWDPDAEFIVDPSLLHHRHPVTPYARMTLRGRVRKTMLRGEIIYDDGVLLSRTSGRMITSAA